MNSDYENGNVKKDYWEEYFYYLVNGGMSSREARRKIEREKKLREKRGKL